MPRYRFVSEIVTLLITVPCAAIAAGRRCYIPAAPEHVSGLLRVLNAHGRNHQFGSVWTEARLRSLARHGLPLERFLVALDGGEVVACGALWDQRAFRQTVIRRLPPLLRALRPRIPHARARDGRSTPARDAEPLRDARVAQPDLRRRVSGHRRRVAGHRTARAAGGRTAMSAVIIAPRDGLALQAGVMPAGPWSSTPLHHAER